jgi:hypothetical protein
LHDGREVTVRAIAEANAPEIVQAFERLTNESRYIRFMHHWSRPRSWRNAHDIRRFY